MSISMRAAVMAWLLSFSGFGLAQQSCANGVRMDGTVADPTGAVIPGAQVRAADGETATTDATGHFLLACVPVGSDGVTVYAEGFTSGSAAGGQQAGEIAHVNLQLGLAQVETEVRVGDDPAAMDADHGAGTTVFNGKDVQRLADDPDDLLRQLQVLASQAGGDPASAVINVDGFQNGSALPPKGSIASIRVNPDLFSSQYSFPPFGGGLIEIFTKPGADSLHGAVFVTDSDGVFNATVRFL